MKGLELDISAAVDEHLHHELEVVRAANVQAHGGEVMAVQEELS